MGITAERMYAIRPFMLSDDFFTDIARNTAAHIAYTARVGLDRTARPKRNELRAVRQREIFPFERIFAVMRKYAPAVRYINPDETAIS